MSTSGTDITVVHVTERAVPLGFKPYGNRNILVLVIGSIEFMIITANHGLGIISNNMRGVNTSVKMIGVYTIVVRNALRPTAQSKSFFSSSFCGKIIFFISSNFKSEG